MLNPATQALADRGLNDADLTPEEWRAIYAAKVESVLDAMNPSPGMPWAPTDQDRAFARAAVDQEHQRSGPGYLPGAPNGPLPETRRDGAELSSRYVVGPDGERIPWDVYVRREAISRAYGLAAEAGDVVISADGLSVELSDVAKRDIANGATSGRVFDLAQRVDAQVPEPVLFSERASYIPHANSANAANGGVASYPTAADPRAQATTPAVQPMRPTAPAGVTAPMPTGAATLPALEPTTGAGKSSGWALVAGGLVAALLFLS